MTRFYFTVHPGDMARGRLLPGSHIMLVASACWDDQRRRFRIRRPPADHIASIALDSGGFTACRRWGQYPWTHQQYIDFVRDTARDATLDFVAIMDYACEREVHRGIHATNRDRIHATLTNDLRLRDLAPDLPWLSVLQGNTLDERAYDLARRRALDLLPTHHAGLGSICGRPATEAAAVLRWYAHQLPSVRYHAFGLDARALDNDSAYFAVASWDSYAWNWARGRKGADRPPHLLRRPGETWSAHVARLAAEYQRVCIQPRLTRPRQLPLLEAACSS